MELPVRCVFESPTVAELGAAVEAARGEPRPSMPPIEALSREGALALSFAQERLWFLDQLEGPSAAYNVPGGVRLCGPLDVVALERSLREIVQRHEVLRTSFPTVEGVAVPQIAPVREVGLPVVELQGLGDEEREAEVRRLAVEEAQRPFDLARGPLLRVCLVKLGEEDHGLLVTLHHIVTDGWSLGVFIHELSALYPAFATGRPSPLVALPIQYADFAAWQREWLQGAVLAGQLGYWQEQLAGAPGLLELPTDHPRPAVQGFRGASVAVELEAELTQGLKALSQRAGVTLFMTLLGAFMVVLARYSRQEDIVVGSPIANRTHRQTEGLIGFFVNTLVLRVDLSGDPPFEELLSRVRRVALEAYAHQEVPFERVVEALQPERSLSHSPLFQVLFALQNLPVGELELPGLSLSPLTLESATAKFDLSLLLSETEGGLVGVWEYSTELFEAATITRLGAHLQTLVEGIVADPKRRLS
ncbi:MAG: condensation domain-containing protein, partial [Burkholderiales bacterium]